MPGEPGRRQASIPAFGAVLLALAPGCAARRPAEPGSSAWIDLPGGGRVYVEVAGQGPEALVVPLPAWPAAELLPLALERRVVFYGLGGRGPSAPPARAPDLADDVRELEAVRCALGLEHFALLGWSYMGAVAAHYALAHPERVSKLVLVAPFPPRREPYWRELLERVGTGGGAAAKVEAALGDWDWSAALGGLRVPALVVQGTADPLPMASAEEWARLLPGARLLALEGVGEAPWLADPLGFFLPVESFLADGLSDEAMLRIVSSVRE